MRRLLSALVALSGLALFAACNNDSFEIVDEGDMRCVEPCEMRFTTVDPTRPNVSEIKLTVQNVGRGDLTIQSVSLVDTSPLVRFGDTTSLNYFDRGGWELNADGHTFTRPDPIILGPQEMLEVELTFGPAENGGQTLCPSGDPRFCGSVVIESNDRNEEDATVTVPIDINLGSGRIAVTPSEVSFPEPQPGSTFVEQFRVSNTGTGVLTITGIDNPDETLRIESASLLPFPIQVAPNLYHDFDVTWSPTSTDALDTAIVIRSDDGSSPSTGLRLRSGAGTSADLDVTPCDIVFDEPIVGEANTVNFDVSNIGGAAMTWSVTLTEFAPNDARNEFSLTRAGATGDVQGNQDSIAPDGSRTYGLVYTPTAERSVAGRLRFSGNFGSTEYCDFRAGPAAPQIDVLPNRLFWGGVEQGESDTRSFVVYNNGRATLDVTGISLTEQGDTVEEFSLDPADAGGFSVPAGGSHRVVVTFTRDTTDVGGPDTASVRIDHNDPLLASVLVQLEANHDNTTLPPTCDIVVDVAEPYSVGQTVTLDASGSTLADGTEWASPNRFQWTVALPDGSATSLSDEFGDTTSITFDVAGTYQVGLLGTAQIGAQAVNCELLRNLLVVP